MKGFSIIKDSTVYVFGGSAGIGLSCAKHLSAMGANIIIFARTKIRLEEAVEEIKKNRLSENVRLAFMEVDVSSPRDVKDVMNQCAEKYGPPDILINCAGRAYPRRFEDISCEQFDETMRVNMYGIWNTCSSAVPIMKKKGGWIVNTSSMAGFLGVFGYTDYAASKFAIMGFSEALRSELKIYNIGVSVLCPPDTDTPGFKIENLTKPEETKLISEGAKIMTPDAVALECIKGISKGRKVIIPGFDGKMTYLVKRIAPSIIDLFISSKIKKAQKQQGRQS